MWADRTQPHLNSVQLQIIKMTTVTRQIRVVIENILDAKDLQKRVGQDLLQNFSTELRSILQNLRYFPTNKIRHHNLKISQKITECREEDQHSEKTGTRFRQGNAPLQSSHMTKDEGRDSIDINELFEQNKQLIQENQFYTKKLEQAESYIKKMEYQQGVLLAEISVMKSDQKYHMKVPAKGDSYEEKESQNIQMQLLNENQDLRAELQETKEFIMRNNEDFVRELQKYNEKIWRLERDSEEYKGKMIMLQGKTEEGELLISKLREENFQLEVLARNMKNLISQQERKDSSVKDYSQGQDSDRLRPQNNKLKDFFRERVQESLRRKDTD